MDRIDQSCLVAMHDVRELAAYLGPELASWWLTAAERHAVGLQAPKPAALPGAVTMLFQRRSSAQAADHNGGLLPLRWRDTPEPRCRLPRGLARVASRVCTELDLSGWHLHLADELSDVDLSDLEIPADSAFLPLAAALQLVAYGGTPAPHVFGTGDWQRGVSSVDGVDDKVCAVQDLLGGLPPEMKEAWIFVPRADEAAARNKAQPWLHVQTWPEGALSVKDATGPFLARFDAIPQSSSELDVRCEWANRPWIQRFYSDRNEYYGAHLLAELAGRTHRLDSRIERLAVPVGFHTNMSRFPIKAWSPAAVLLLASGASQKNAKEVKEEHGNASIELLPDAGGGAAANEYCRLVDRIAAWLQEGEGHAAVDITAGTVLMSSILQEAARRAGAQAFYVQHKHNGRYQIFGEERILELSWC